MKKSMLFLLCVIVAIAHAQVSDSSSKKINPKCHEIGVNLLPPLLFISNANGVQPKFFNATYRYLKNEKHAFRVTAGINVYNSGGFPSFRTDVVLKSNNFTIYKNTSDGTPANFMGGIGYERIFGKRKLKHVIGCDMTYNYVGRRTSVDYYGLKDSLVNGNLQREFVPIDTGKTIVHKYYNKVGIAPFYSIRYELSSKWLITASTRVNLQYSQMTYAGYPKIASFDFNASGLLSELSLFYRF